MLGFVGAVDDAGWIGCSRFPLTRRLRGSPLGGKLITGWGRGHQSFLPGTSLLACPHQTQNSTRPTVKPPPFLGARVPCWPGRPRLPPHCQHWSPRKPQITSTELGNPPKLKTQKPPENPQWWRGVLTVRMAASFMRLASAAADQPWVASATRCSMASPSMGLLLGGVGWGGRGGVEGVAGVGVCKAFEAVAPTARTNTCNAQTPSPFHPQPPTPPQTAKTPPLPTRPSARST